MSLFCHALLCVHFSFINHLEEEEKADCFDIIVLQLFCYYNCSVALPHSDVGWSALCDYGVS